VGMQVEGSCMCFWSAALCPPLFVFRFQKVMQHGLLALKQIKEEGERIEKWG